jgi:hypothetical protein
LKAAYLAGFNASGEGYNGEYPFGDHVQDPEEDAAWRKNRDDELTAIKQALAAQHEHEPENEPFVSLASVQEPVAYRSLLASGSYTYCNTPQFFDNAQALYTTPPAQPAPVQERTDYAVHLNHCNIGECEGVCKYGDDDCPALEHADMKAKWDRPTPPAAQPAPVQEPVAYAVYHRMGGGKSLHWPEQHSENGDANEYKLFPLYTTLPAAQPASVQEPIYQMQMMDGKWIDQAKQSYEYNKAHGNTVRIVYTTPPAAHDLQAELDATNRQVEILSDALAESQRQRQWVGLTPTERKQIEKRYVFVEDAIRLTEAKLKEKNT